MGRDRIAEGRGTGSFPRPDAPSPTRRLKPQTEAEMRAFKRAILQAERDEGAEFDKPSKGIDPKEPLIALALMALMVVAGGLMLWATK